MVDRLFVLRLACQKLNLNWAVILIVAGLKAHPKKIELPIFEFMSSLFVNSKSAGAM
jgi:hypothetical protein